MDVQCKGASYYESAAHERFVEDMGDLCVCVCVQTHWLPHSLNSLFFHSYFDISPTWTMSGCVNFFFFFIFIGGVMTHTFLAQLWSKIVLECSDLYLYLSISLAMRVYVSCSRIELCVWPPWSLMLVVDLTPVPISSCAPWKCLVRNQ